MKLHRTDYTIIRSSHLLTFITAKVKHTVPLCCQFPDTLFRQITVYWHLAVIQISKQLIPKVVLVIKRFRIVLTAGPLFITKFRINTTSGTILIEEYINLLSLVHMNPNIIFLIYHDILRFLSSSIACEHPLRAASWKRRIAWLILCVTAIPSKCIFPNL